MQVEQVDQSEVCDRKVTKKFGTRASKSIYQAPGAGDIESR